MRGFLARFQSIQPLPRLEKISPEREHNATLAPGLLPAFPTGGTWVYRLTFMNFCSSVSLPLLHLTR
jgi:hypothetical protein